MLMSLLIVAFGGAIGAVWRYLTVTLAMNLLGMRFPYGTLLVNSLGSFLVGFFMVIILERCLGNDFWRLFLVVGFLGGYTTFSSFSWETWALYESGQYLLVGLNVLINNVLAIGLVFVGVHFGRYLINYT